MSDCEAVLRDLLSRPAYAFARSVTVDVNQGYGHGMATGLHAARGRVLAFSHADMQCDPLAVFQAFDALKDEGHGAKVIVKGRRRGRAWPQQLITHGMSLWATLVLWRPLSDINAQPKVFPAGLLPHLKAMPTGFEFDVYVLYRALSLGYRLKTVPVVFGTRAHGESKWAATTVGRWRTILRVAGYILALRFKVRA